MAESVLELVDVVRRFGRIDALAGVDLELQRGEVVGLLGHNGAGKTTVVRILAGLLAVDRGCVRVFGMDPIVDGKAVRRRLGVLPARPLVDDRLTAFGNLRFAADVFELSRSALSSRIDAALDRFDLTSRKNDRVATFSTGMRQRLSLARVLLTDPEVLLLDEPTSGLDPVAARSVRDVVADLAREQQRSVVLCTHDLAEAELLCDRVVVLEHGRMVAAGRPSELQAQHGTGGLLLEVEPSDVPAARAMVAQVTPDPPQTAGGGRIRAVGVPRQSIPTLINDLAKAEITVYEVRRLEPTLEDVYLTLHRRADRIAPATEGAGT
jgi:ABC-type multidrug transport system ATPase subunit